MEESRSTFAYRDRRRSLVLCCRDCGQLPNDLAGRVSAWLGLHRNHREGPNSRDLEPYPQSNPGYFLLWSITIDCHRATIVSLEPVLAAACCCDPARVVMRRYLPKVVSQRESTPTAAALFAFLVMNFNTNEFMFAHFNTRLLSILLVSSFFLLLLLRPKDLPTQSAALLVIYTSLVIAHPLNSLLVVVFLGRFHVRQVPTGRLQYFVSLLCIVIYMFWSAYVYRSRQ